MCVSSSRLTLADFLVRHVVAGREAVLGHRHVGVEGQRQDPRGRLDLRRHPGPAVPANQGTHWEGETLLLVRSESIFTGTQTSASARWFTSCFPASFANHSFLHHFLLAFVLCSCVSVTLRIVPNLNMQYFITVTADVLHKIHWKHLKMATVLSVI